MLHALTSLLALTVLASPAQDPEKAPAGTWILQIEGDADSLALTGASHKTSAYRAPRGATKSDWRVALVDRAGAIVAEVQLDLSRHCMDRGHLGRGAHVHGDVAVEHQVAVTVKVPARADAVTLRIENVTDPKKPVLLGEIARDSVLAAVAKSATPKEAKKSKESVEEKKDR